MDDYDRYYQRRATIARLLVLLIHPNWAEAPDDCEILGIEPPTRERLKYRMEPELVAETLAELLCGEAP